MMMSIHMTLPTLNISPIISNSIDKCNQGIDLRYTITIHHSQWEALTITKRESIKPMRTTSTAFSVHESNHHTEI